MRRRELFIFFISIILFISDFAFAQYENVKDHPALSRYRGSQIVHYDFKQFDEYYILLGPIRGSSDKDIEGAECKRLEGKVTRFLYEGPKDRSSFEVFKNYEIALKNAGYKILFQGKGREEIYGVYVFLEKKNKDHLGGWGDPDKGWYYLSASSPDEKIYISIFVLTSSNGPRAAVSIIEPKEMEVGLVTAEMMEESIKRTGKVALYTIYFDFDKADLKPESKPTIGEIAKLLKRNPKLKLYIVGHTDNVGSFDYNMDLSQRRAEAVVKELVEEHGISKDRLKPYGVGPLCPISSNLSEEGRSKNRRVELVEQ
uniref:OmpA-like domain-containing protein n=1 Tax=candidate division WOR-3 bacterium TaxID=2052148 RepID=A0A7C2P3T0_UNCW3